MALTVLVATGIVTIAGFMRGVTGFGGAMLMAPPLSFLLGPVPAVVITLLLEAAAALVMFPDAWHRIHGRILTYILVPACLTVPIGGYLLLSLEPALARKVISGVVVVFSLALLLGFRFSKPPRPSMSLTMGTIAGVLLGATGIGGPPVILYLLSGPDPQVVTRANLTVFVTTISMIGLIMLSGAGAISGKLLLSAAALSPPYLLTTWLGGVMFRRMTDQWVRWVALGLMFGVGIVGLFL